MELTRTEKFLENTVAFLSRLDSYWGMLLAGGVLGLSMPGYNLWFIAWIGLVPWFFVESKNTWKPWLIKSFLFGAGFHGVTMVWLLSLHPMNWIGFNTFFSLLVATLAWVITMAMGGLLFTLLGVAYKGLCKISFGWVLFPLVWIFLYDHFDITQLWVPWARLEISQIDIGYVKCFWENFYFWLLIIPNTGLKYYHLISFFIVLFNLFFFHTLTTSKNLIHSKLFILFLVLIWVSPFTYLSSALIEQSIKRVDIRQGNIPIQHIKGIDEAKDWSEKSYFKNLDYTHSLIDILAFPEEGLIPQEVIIQAPEENSTVGRLSGLANIYKKVIIAGVTTYDRDKKASYNSLILISPEIEDKIIYDFYHKQKLVPFGEYTPFIDEDFLVSVLNGFGILYSSGFNRFDYKNTEDTLLHSGDLIIGPLICFELIYPKIGISYNQSGAKFLLNSSNLGWFHHNKILNKQFIAHGKIMAFSSRLPVLIVNNVGSSGIIDHNGKFYEVVGLNKQNTNPDLPNYQEPEE